MTKGSKKDPISRREFIGKLGTAVAGIALAGVSGVLIKRAVKESETELFWQIDPAQCTHCGRCETGCVLRVSAVKCVHAKKVCGYCDLCGGYYRPNAKVLDTAAENLACPTGALMRKFIEEPYFEYTVDESLCNGCGKCAKGCNAFGNGSLYLQIKQELCKNCNECSITKVCPSNAIERVPARLAYNLKDR